MAQGFRFLFQFRLLSVFQSGFFQLFQLKADIVFILTALFSLCDEIIQFLCHLFIGKVYRLISRQCLLVLCQDVQNVQLESFLVQQQVLVLAVHVNQFFAQHFHLCQRSRRIVDKSTAFSVGRHFTTEDTFVRLEFDVILLKERFHAVVGNPESRFHDALGSPLLDGFHVGTLSQQESDGP